MTQPEMTPLAALMTAKEHGKLKLAFANADSARAFQNACYRQRKESKLGEYNNVQVQLNEDDATLYLLNIGPISWEIIKTEEKNDS